MKARLVVHYAGNEYYGKWYEKDSTESLADQIQDLVRGGDSLQLVTKDDSHIIFGETVLKSCVIIVERFRAGAPKS